MKFVFSIAGALMVLAVPWSMHRLSCPSSCRANIWQWAPIPTTLPLQKCIWQRVLNGCPMRHVFRFAFMD